MVFEHMLYRNKGAQADLIVETVLLFLDYVTLGLRLWSRKLVGTGLKASDWLIITATVCLLDSAFCISFERQTSLSSLLVMPASYASSF